MDDRVKERLMALRALALRGVDGEKQNAEELLDKLCRKYGVSVSSLDEVELRDYEFEYHGEEQLKLLRQIVYKVMNDLECFHRLYYTGSGRKCKTRVSVTCTEAQRLEIDFLFEFYCRLYEQERAILLLAFIQKHALFGDKYDGGQSKYSKDELLRIATMGRALKDATPRKLLGDGHDGNTD